ncbi:hypothetical protein [Teredinibacter turnerae]|uniref:hypothetical protein n=1 Tax=Teredinibacter turnerae TaxID=2426 RepID=UPI0004921E92|nr:hypothetical protein [Teredinibacter turnerae]
MELYISIGSLVVACCAIGLTVWQATIQRIHNRISVKPHLMQATTKDKTGDVASLHVCIINNGLGPAFIDSFSVLYQGTPTSLEDGLSEALGDLTKNMSSTSLACGSAIAAGESVQLVRVKFNAPTDHQVEQVKAKLNDLDMVIKYSSAYEKIEPFDTRS